MQRCDQNPQANVAISADYVEELHSWLEFRGQLRGVSRLLQGDAERLSPRIEGRKSIHIGNTVVPRSPDFLPQTQLPLLLHCQGQ